MTVTNDPFTRPVFKRLRRLCLALPEVSEVPAWGHPTFRVSGKTFCAFEIVKGRPSIAFRLPKSDVADVAAREPGFATPYGRGKWASLWLDGKVDWPAIEKLVRVGYRTIAPKRLQADELLPP
jgi:predicted DNA-binding protein (MmcQ/YjbR family)